jgi:TPR repeat protein
VRDALWAPFDRVPAAAMLGVRRQHPLLLLPAPGAPTRPCAEDLPLELAQLILEQLDEPRDVSAARGVCRRWRVIVDASPVIWRGLSFNESPRMHRAAAGFYRRAAANGNTKAAFTLALLYAYGYRGDPE